MRKMTVRADEEQAALFAAFCARNGVSMQSVLVSMLLEAVEEYGRHEETPVSDWPPEYKGWQALIDRARNLDAQKRVRKGRPAPAP